MATQVMQKGDKFYAECKFCKPELFDTREQAQMVADISDERDPVKAQALIDAMRAKFPLKAVK